ncbi:hypothetical protein JAAARDRAFT_116131, partial [Jaapia argillacea MUCL 33604]
GYPCRLEDLALHISQPNLAHHVQRFLYQELHLEDERLVADVPLSECPPFNGPVSVFHSAEATYYALSDLSGIGGTYQERIQANPSWRKG